MTFDKIYKIVKPASPESEWTPQEKTRIANLVRRGKVTVYDLLETMELFANEWSNADRRTIGRKLSLMG